MVRVDVKPSDPIDEQPTIGLIGMGAMGTIISVCDRPEKFESLKLTYQGNPASLYLSYHHVVSHEVVLPDIPAITVHRDGHAVSRISDFIMYSVEADLIHKVVAQYGPSTKVGAIVSGQTSVKTPERDAFEKHLPSDVHIVSMHSLHGPTVSPVGQPLVLVPIRAPDECMKFLESVFSSFRSRYVYLTYEEHDLITANVQAVTHAAFLTMGTAWAAQRSYPWEQAHYVGGIETVKVNIMLRIYANKWHVYAGLAILNPSAKIQIDTFASSATDLYKLMIAGDAQRLRERIYAAREKVFGVRPDEDGCSTPIFLTEDVLDQFSIGKRSSPSPSGGNNSLINSHLSLLAMVDCWARLGIQPFDHLQLAATPVFRMWIGVAEYLFRSTERLNAALDVAVHDVTLRSDDLEFVIAARGWSQCVAFGNFELYRDRFERTAAFFESRFEEANKLGSAMIKAIQDSNGVGK
ncbi:hypothetical protein PISMIDRAFT_24113 [Pisolithus microcarpus 441]|uniref:Prephenate/arogenate dehydrogenase domain-containing protein n=1 Tax=Pisolithus microcarpus 441 TaxID=765257 RepID=A0A0C9ZEE0_9AGAM|nr:hypothetical protein PISMIDRAFT_24113 [Pisolithus microcarpus 441]